MPISSLSVAERFVRASGEPTCGLRKGAPAGVLAVWGSGTPRISQIPKRYVWSSSAAQLIVNSPTGGHTGFCNFSLIAQFGVWLEGNEPLGKAFDDSTGFELPNGARLGWLIDPEDKHIDLYHPGQPVEVMDRPNTLSGETVVPGFTLSLERIWS
jgi:Uma2 family endonuclease